MAGYQTRWHSTANLLAIPRVFHVTIAIFPSWFKCRAPWYRSAQRQSVLVRYPGIYWGLLGRRREWGGEGFVQQHHPPVLSMAGPGLQQGTGTAATMGECTAAAHSAWAWPRVRCLACRTTGQCQLGQAAGMAGAHCEAESRG